MLRVASFKPSPLMGEGWVGVMVGLGPMPTITPTAATKLASLAKSRASPIKGEGFRSGAPC